MSVVCMVPFPGARRQSSPVSKLLTAARDSILRREALRFAGTLFQASTPPTSGPFALLFPYLTPPPLAALALYLISLRFVQHFTIA